MSEKEKQEAKRNYLNDLHSDMRYSVSKFDSQTLAICGGALAFSLTFVNEIIPLNEASFNWILYCALVLFIFCITGGFIGHYLSMKYTYEIIEKAIEDNYDQGNGAKNIRNLNLSIVIAIPTGIIMLVLFCVMNIETAKNKELNNSSEQQQIEIIASPNNNI